MKEAKLYPPGGGVPVVPHPAKVAQMKSNGWTENQPKQKPVKEDK